MFKKEAEEILNNHCDCELLFECMTGIRCRCSDFEEEKKLLLEGIEFGYSKANEELGERLDKAKEMLEQFIKFSMFPLTTKKDIEDVQILLKSASQFCKESE